MRNRTDLAIEAKQLWEQSTDKTTKLSGVEAFRDEYGGMPVDVVKILDEVGEEALGKPRGTYMTLELPRAFRSDRVVFEKLAQSLAAMLRLLLPDSSRPMAVGLGNREITPDSVGPRTLDHLVITGHMPHNPFFGQLYAMEPGVLAQTGIESLALVRGAVEQSSADCVIVVDALASCDPDRLCRSVQLTDAGIVPGSGVGNSREGFDRRTLGVPVVALGVPTVTDQGGGHEGDMRLILSTADIDLQVANIARVIGYGIDLFVHRKLSTQDIPWLLS